MGFNIGVWSEQITNNYDCHNFIDRNFYNFIASGEMYKEQSILLQSGKYYGLNLSPFLKLVYTWDEVTPDYVKANIQDTDTLLLLAINFRNAIEKDNSVCEKITYSSKEDNKEGNNPWKFYFETGEIINDLNSLIKSIECYKSKGATDIYLTAG